MESPGDGWENELVRASAAHAGSFCSFLQAVSSLTDRLHRLDQASDCRHDPVDPSSSPQSAFSGDAGTSVLKMSSGGSLSGLLARSGIPVAIYGTAKRIAGQKSMWMGAMGVAAAASLSAALAAHASELPLRREGLNGAEGRRSRASNAQSFVEAGDGVAEAEEDSLSGRSPGSSFDDLVSDKEGSSGEALFSPACVAVIAGKTKGGMVEPKTKIRFPLLLCEKEGSDLSKDDSEKCQVLAGVGVRSKNFVNVKTIKIYAFGVYVQPDKLKKVFAEKYRGVPPQELKLRDEFYDDLLSEELGMTVRLVVFYKGLNMEMVRSAFVTSLKNRLRKIKGTEEDDGLHTFSGYFSQPMSISRGTTIDFRWEPGGRLLTEIAGKQMEPIVSPHLCRALFDVYIGEPPVSVKTKQQIGESFARMLAAC